MGDNPDRASAAEAHEVDAHAEEAPAAAPAEPEDISMEDVLGAGTRKRPVAATEEVDELHAETGHF